MKVTLAWWVSRPSNLPEWFEHNKEIDITPEQIMELYNTGNNVMLWHSSDGKTVVFVDHKRFTQR